MQCGILVDCVNKQENFHEIDINVNKIPIVQAGAKSHIIIYMLDV